MALMRERSILTMAPTPQRRGKGWLRRSVHWQMCDELLGLPQNRRHIAISGPPLAEGGRPGDVVCVPAGVVKGSLAAAAAAAAA